MVPSAPSAGEESSIFAPVVNTHRCSGEAGPVKGLRPVCCGSWWNIHQSPRPAAPTYMKLTATL